MPVRPEVFVSATSADLKSSREAARNALLRAGCYPVEQTTFPPQACTVREALRKQLATCVAVVHVAGRCYGSEPSEREEASRRRSYTQLEHDIAREMGKQVFLFVCGDKYEYDEHEEEPADKRKLQLEYLRGLLSGDHRFDWVHSKGDLERGVLSLQLWVEQLSRKLARSKWITAGAIAASLATVSALGYGGWKIADSLRTGQAELEKGRKEQATENEKQAAELAALALQMDELKRQTTQREGAGLASSESQAHQEEVAKLNQKMDALSRQMLALVRRELPNPSAARTQEGFEQTTRSIAASSGLTEERVREIVNQQLVRAEGDPKVDPELLAWVKLLREALDRKAKEPEPGPPSEPTPKPPVTPTPAGDPEPSPPQPIKSQTPEVEQPPLVPLSESQLLARARGAVFRVVGRGRVDGKDRKSEGVGCLVGEEGLAVISLDAVVGADDVRAEFDGQGRSAKVELVAYRTDLGLALARVDVSGLARKDRLAAFEPGEVDPTPDSPVWGVSAHPAVSLKAGRLRGTVMLSQLPEKTGQSLDFAPSSRWYTTDVVLVGGSSCVPVVDQYGRVIGWGEPAEKAPEGGSLVRAVDAIAALMAEAPSDRARWSDLATEVVQEALPRSLKPQWMLIVTSPSGDLSSALSVLRTGWDCPRCGTAGTVVDSVKVKDGVLRPKPNGLPGFDLTKPEYKSVTVTCPVCQGNKCAPADDLYRDIGKVVRGLRKLKAEDARFPALKQRADKEFGRMAATSLSGLASCNARARSIMSGEFKRDQVLVGVGRVSQKREEGGKMVFWVSLEGGQIRVEGPVVFNADASDTALVAGILENGSPASGASGWVIREGVVFASRPDYLEKKK